ncbi:hypothetical protein Pmar_PMAR010983, partial [Perkinsus marinus ATCC 50983]
YTALVDRLGAYLNSLDGVGLMNTLWALVRLNAAAPKWISELLDRCISSVDQLEPKQLGQGLYCVYRMSKHAAPTEAVKALQSALHVDQLTAALGTSLAKLGIRDETVFSALGSRLSDKMDDFDMEDIAAVSWAFARAKFTDRELFRKIRESLTVRTTECSVKSLVSLTWSLSKLGETGGEEDLFRYTLAPTIRSYMLEYTVQDLCALAWSFANANVHDVDFMSDIAHALMPKTRDMNCQDVCSAVVALASLHYSHKELFEALKQQSFRLMHTFTPLQLSRTLYGFGVAGVRDKKLFYEMTLTSIDKLHLMYAKNVCDILSALMEAEYLIPELTRPLLDHLSRQLDRLGRQNVLSNDRLLENTLMVLSPASKAPSWCCADLPQRSRDAVKVGSMWMLLLEDLQVSVCPQVLLHKHVGLQNAFNRLFEELCASTLSRLDQETVADVVYACARIGYDDGMFVQRLIEHVDQHLASSGGFHSFQSMARLVYALCELNTRLDMARVLCREAIDGQMWEGGSGDDVLLLAWAAVVGLFMKVILNAESQFLSLPPPVDLITEMCVLFEERLPTQLLLAQQSSSTDGDHPGRSTRWISRVLSDTWASLRNHKALIDCCKELKSPGGDTSAGEEHQGGGGSLTAYESDMLNTGSPMTLGLIAALTYPITWRSVSRMHLFRNRPVIPQFLAIVWRPIQPHGIMSIDSLQVHNEGERSSRARDVIDFYREKAPVDYETLRQQSM